MHCALTGDSRIETLLVAARKFCFQLNHLQETRGIQQLNTAGRVTTTVTEIWRTYYDDIMTARINGITAHHIDFQSIDLRLRENVRGIILMTAQIFPSHCICSS